LGSQAVKGAEEIIFETSVAAESVRDFLDNIHDNIHSRLQLANDSLANVQVMKVSHVPDKVAYEIQVHTHSFTSVVSEMYAWVYCV